MARASKKSKIERTYEFFKQMEEEQRPISSSDMIAATGYTVGTVRTYIAKKWNVFLISTVNGFYSVKGVQDQTLQDFIVILQKRPPSSMPRRLVLQLPYALSEWLYKQAAHQGCHVQDLVLDVLEHHRQAH